MRVSFRKDRSINVVPSLGGSHKSWKDRWFILTSTSLAYYKQRDDAAPISSIELSTVSSCRAEPNDTKAKLTCLFSVATEGRVYLISAKSDIERDEWVQSIGSQLAGGSGGAITETAASGSVAHHSGAAAIPVASSDDKPTQWVRRDLCVSSGAESTWPGSRYARRL